MGSGFTLNPYRHVMEFRRGEVTVTDAVSGTPVSKMSLLAINELPIEDYLKGVLPSEMPASWPLEALKAQAVAARSYAVNHIRSLPEGGWIDDTTKYQKYDGFRVEHERTNEAIRQTAGEVLTHQGRVITAWFSASNGDTRSWRKTSGPPRPLTCGVCRTRTTSAKAIPTAIGK